MWLRKPGILRRVDECGIYWPDRHWIRNYFSYSYLVWRLNPFKEEKDMESYRMAYILSRCADLASSRNHCWATATALCQLTAFLIVTHSYETADIFAQARPGELFLFPLYVSWGDIFCPIFAGAGYVLNTLSWIFGLLIVVGVIVTGLAADSGHRWAAGNRAYRSIPEGR